MSRVFLSYSHDSPEHRDRVLAVAHRLLAAGYDVRLDRFTGHPGGESWPQWMCRQVREADWIVCVCTATYRKRFEGDETVGGFGVSWEGHLLTTELYLNRGRAPRIVPVFVNGDDDVPFVLRGHAPRSIDAVDDLISALGGIAGPPRSAPAPGQGMTEVVSVGRLLDRLFRPPRQHRGVAGYLPSQLLRPEHAIVPFIGAEALLRDLLEWSAGGGARVRIVHGPGGAGKTRLALEVAGRLVREGWRAGPLAWRQLSDEALDELFRDPIPLFLVLDYAETRPQEVVQVLRRLSDHPDANARVLLLARGIGDWWDRAKAQVPDLAGFAHAEPIRVEAVEDGALHARKAAEAFAGWQGVAAPASVPDRGRTALDRQVEALLAVLRGTTPGIDGLLDHERAYVDGAAKAEEIPLARARLLLPAMALVTLAGGVTADAAAEWLRAVPGLGGLDEADALQIVDLLTGLYPRVGGGIDGVRPDRVGESLVARQDKNGALALVAVDRGRVKPALTVLTRLGAAGERGPLERVIQKRRATVAIDAVEVAKETGDPIGQVLAASLEVEPDPVLAGKLADAVPVETVALRELGIVAGRQAVEAAADDGERARRLNSLAVDLVGAGRREDALEASGQAVAIARRLELERPGRYTKLLCWSLSSHSNILSALGRPHEALAPAEEAAGLWRKPGLRLTPASRADFAAALSNLGACLGDLDRDREALVCARDAVAILQDLANDDPVLYEPKLGRGLNNLAVVLASLGEDAEALTTAERAVATIRTLYTRNRDAFAHELAVSLLNLSHRMFKHGRLADALSCADEAARILGPLASAHPGAFEPELARVLNTRATRLWSLNRCEEAITAVEESISLLSPYFVRTPDAFVRSVGVAVHNYVYYCAQRGRPPDPALLAPILPLLEETER